MTTKPCRICGSADRYPSGDCKACNARRVRERRATHSRRYLAPPCVRCGCDERERDGDCANCRKMYERARWRERHPQNENHP